MVVKWCRRDLGLSQIYAGFSFRHIDIQSGRRGRRPGAAAPHLGSVAGGHAYFTEARTEMLPK